MTANLITDELIQFSLVGSHALLAVLASIHVLLYKKDQRAALGWIAACLFFPVLGSFIYYMFGINRVRARAQSMAKKSFWRWSVPHEKGEKPRAVRPALGTGEVDRRDVELKSVSDAVSGENLRAGNDVLPLFNGEQAFPQMLQEIDSATESILLMTFIMRMDDVGGEFVAALQRASMRGVLVLVIIDGIGDYYSWPRASRVLRGAGLHVARFFPPRILPPSRLLNLRNHRKLLICDGATAFTGGMNIGDNHCLDRATARDAIADVHFRFKGSIVEDLERHFYATWARVAEKRIERPSRQPIKGHAICRMLVAGPDENMDRLELIFNGAIASARKSIDIMTPYFLPSRDMLAALKSAALKGVNVRVFLPARSNLRSVDWATRNLLWELLQWNVNIFYQAPPFCHAKLFTVDHRYSIVGSANLDPRSLRLNFELCVEMFDVAIAEIISEQCDRAVLDSEIVTLAGMESRSLPARLRDALFWLLSPYL